jgi:hypothetical protein
MIVSWSETYLRTSLTTALATIHSSPPNISGYLVEPTPVVERHVHVPPPSTTQLRSIVNRTDQERQAAAATVVSNLPDVCIDRSFRFDFIVFNLGLDTYRCSRCE